MPSSPTIALAITELVYYTPTLVPLSYCIYSHRKTGLLGWMFFLVFVLLQITGSALTLSKGHTTSTVAILTGVGISPLLLGTAGVVHEIFKKNVSRVQDDGSKRREKKGNLVMMIIYHIIVMTGVALYAVGKSKSSSSPAVLSKGRVLGEVGIIMLLIAWLLLAAVCVRLACWTEKRKEMRALRYAVQSSVVLLGIRLVYSCVLTFLTASVFDVVGGSVAMKVVFEFLTGAVVVAVMVSGGVLTHWVDGEGDVESLVRM